MTAFDLMVIGVIGLAFKENTDDLRESPIVEIVEMLIKRGADQCVRDKAGKTALDLAANDNVCVDRSQQLGERARAFWSRSQETAFGTVTSHAALISP